MSKAHKQMPGRTYRINYHGDSATVECTYMCPYCRHDVTAYFNAPSSAFARLETGGFFEELTCESCGEIADVRYFGPIKI